MKIGDYVRTIYGIKRIDEIICGQDVRFDNIDGFDDDLLNWHSCDGISIYSHKWKEIVIGEPKEKTIDLIEVGDYVNGYKVYNIGITELSIGKVKSLTIEGYGRILEEDIKSIVTREQFDNMKYEVK